VFLSSLHINCNTCYFSFENLLGKERKKERKKERGGGKKKEKKNEMLGSLVKQKWKSSFREVTHQWQ